MIAENMIHYVENSAISLERFMHKTAPARPSIRIDEVITGSPPYKQCLDLRDQVLRRPLGRNLTPEDIEGENVQYHLRASAQDGALLGCVVLKPISKEVCKLRQMAVAADWQGLGIGRELVLAAERLAVAQGFLQITLAARATAIEFYRKLGYQILSDEFLEVGIPHRMMSKSLT